MKDESESNWSLSSFIPHPFQKHLHDVIPHHLHPQFLIGRLRDVIVMLDVKPHADDIRLRACVLQQVLEELAKDAVPARRRCDVDALDPPKVAVAPVAPFAGDSELADALPLEFRDEVASLERIAEH